jgi:hypothetical protein
VLSTLSFVAVASLVLALAPEAVLQRLGVRENLDGTRRLLGPQGIRLLRIGFGGLSALAGTLVVAGFLAPERIGPLLERRTRSLRWLARAAWDDGSAFVRHAGATLPLATAVGALLRGIGLRRPIEFDEATTAVYFTSRTVLDAVSDYTFPNNHVLHSVLAHVSTILFGPGEIALRLPSFVAGTLLIPATAWLTWRLGGRGAVRATAWFVALCPPLVIYAALARGYTISALLAVASMIVISFDDARLRSAGLASGGVLLGLALWAVPTTAMAAITIGLFAVFSARGRAGLANGLLLALVTTVTAVALYSPILATMGLDALVGHEFASQGPGWEHTLAEVQALTALPPWALGLLGLALGILASRDREVRRSEGALVAFATVAGVTAFALVLSRNIPARAFVAQVPLLIAGIAAIPALRPPSFLRTGRPLRVIVTLGALWLVAATWTFERSVEHDGRAPAGLHAVIRSLAPRLEQGGTLVVDVSEAFGDQARYYAMREGLDPFSVQHVLHPEQLSELAPGQPAFLITRTPPHGPGTHFAAFLDGGGGDGGGSPRVDRVASPASDLDVLLVRP